MINNSQNISSSSTSVKKAEVDSQYLEVKSCNKTTLNAIPVNNGDFYHTTDTNEFFHFISSLPIKETFKTPWLVFSRFLGIFSISISLGIITGLNTFLMTSPFSL